MDIPSHLSFIISLVKQLSTHTMYREVAIINLIYLLPELPLDLLPLFDGNDRNVTHINPTELLRTYSLPSILPLWPIVLTSATLCHILLYTPPFDTSRYVILGMISDIVVQHSKLDLDFESMLSCVVTRSISTDNTCSLIYDQDSATRKNHR